MFIIIIIILIIIVIYIKHNITSESFITENTYDVRINMFKTTISIMNKYNIKYWADFGTLLGLIREGTLIRHDDDSDICIFNDEKDKINDVILQEFIKHNMIIVRSINSAYKVYMLNDYINQTKNKDVKHIPNFYCDECPHVDIFVYQKTDRCAKRECTLGWNTSCDDIIKRDNIDISLLQQFEYRYFEKLDLNVRIPHNDIDILLFRYGKNWKVPIKNDKGVFKGCE